MKSPPVGTGGYIPPLLKSFIQIQSQPNLECLNSASERRTLISSERLVNLEKRPYKTGNDWQPSLLRENFAEQVLC
jgi:hypothetical protein